MTPEQHLAHLKALIAPPYTNGWWEYVKGLAEDLAMGDSAYASFPSLLRAEWERIRAEAVASRSPSALLSRRASTSPSRNVSRETKAARTPSATSKSSTGPRAFS